MELLLYHNAKMEKDFYGVTPLIAAALTGHSHIVELIIGSSNCERDEKIDALELLGATYVDKVSATSIVLDSKLELCHRNAI